MLTDYTTGSVGALAARVRLTGCKIESCGAYANSRWGTSNDSYPGRTIALMAMPPGKPKAGVSTKYA